MLVNTFDSMKKSRVTKSILFVTLLLICLFEKYKIAPIFLFVPQLAGKEGVSCSGEGEPYVTGYRRERARFPDSFSILPGKHGTNQRSGV